MPPSSASATSAGGTGKTPLAILIAEELARAGAAPVFLTRGYGGRAAGPVFVDPARDGVREVGDEPLLLARVAPTIVARDRRAGLALIERGERPADVVVMDDGLQNPHIAKDLTIAVVDGARGVGNGEIIPAGPLRPRSSSSSTSSTPSSSMGPRAGRPRRAPAIEARLPRPRARGGAARRGRHELACRRRRRRLRGHRQSTSLFRAARKPRRAARGGPRLSRPPRLRRTRCRRAAARGRCGLGCARHHGEGPRASAGGDGPTRRASRAFARAADPALARRARHGPARCAAGGRAQLARPLAAKL